MTDASLSARHRSILTVPCSSGALSGAITTANGLDFVIIRLSPNCTYSIATPAVADTALPQITGNITLLGGPGTVIRRDVAAQTQFRILDVAPGATLRVLGISIENGNALIGGGINNSGTTTLRFVTLIGNTARLLDGGGFSNDANAQAFIADTVVKENTASGGGGISNSGRMTVINTRITANSAPIGGGGGFITGLDANSTIIRTTIDHNFAGFAGGGILNLGVMSIDRSLIVHNKNSPVNGFSGGGLYTVSPTVTVRRSIIRANSPNNCFPVNGVPGCVN
jgi:hypothetical protein